MRHTLPRPAYWTDREYRRVLVMRRISGWLSAVAGVGLTVSLLAADRWLNAITVVVLGASWFVDAHGERYRNDWPVSWSMTPGRYATRREGSA